MNRQNKRKILTLGVLIVLVIAILLIAFPKDKENVINISQDLNKDMKNYPSIALMIETTPGSGEYELSNANKWPTTGYVFNSDMSYCEKGSELLYDETNGLQLKTSISDKCYIYYDNVVDLSVTPFYNNVVGAPTTVGPQATIGCNGATATYNPKTNEVEVTGISTPQAKCNLNYTNRTSKTYLNNKIIGLAGTTQGTGQVVNENGYRYEGKDPNNYIWFNNELWRIIGVFDSASHGQSGQNLVKIIRDQPLGGFAWHKSDTNDWSASSLKKLWNPIDGDGASGSYYNKTNGTGNTYCYGYSTTIPGNCNYSGKGIDETYRGMVKNVTWYLGGHSSTAITTSTMYGYERDATKKYSSNPASDTGYIGLMYASDYGYSVLASSCARTTSLSSYNKASCSGQSWLYGNSFEWTITPASNNSTNSFLVSNNFYLNNAYISYNARPVLYLDSSVYFISGTGTINDPYIIGM